jgi:hypothetical protein
MALFVVMLQVATHAVLGAQTPELKAVLSRPSGPIMCREIATSAADSAAFVFEFADGQIATGTRLLITAYDSAGAPVYAALRLIARPDTAVERVQLLAARFTGVRSGSRMRVIDGKIDSSEVLTAADSAAQMPRGGKVLSQEELMRAYELSVWLWNHRCAARPDDRRSGRPAPAG